MIYALHKLPIDKREIEHTGTCIVWWMITVELQGICQYMNYHNELTGES